MRNFYSRYRMLKKTFFGFCLYKNNKRSNPNHRWLICKIKKSNMLKFKNLYYPEGCAICVSLIELLVQTGLKLQLPVKVLISSYRILF